MGVPNSQLTTNFVAKYQLITGFFWPIISKLLTPLVPSHACFGYNGHRRSTICSIPGYVMERDGTPVFFEIISFWGNFYVEEEFSPREALFVLGGSAEKNINNPTVGPDYFVLQKPPSSQKCLNNFVDDC